MSENQKSKPELVSELERLRSRLLELEEQVAQKNEPAADYTATNVQLQREMYERKRVEKVLAEERDLLRTLIDSLPDNIYVKDAQCKYLIDNMAHTRFLGAGLAEQVMGRTVYNFFPQKLADQYQADDQAVITSAQPLINREEPILDRNGKRRWISTSKIPVADNSGKIVRLVCISRDITELKKAEGALAEERNLLRTLIDNMPDYIFVKDAKSRVVISNKSHVRELGASKPEEVIGKTDFDFFPQELAGRYFADEQEIIATGKSLIDREEPTIDTGGNVRWLSTTKVPLCDARGHIIRIVGMSRDITERKHFEDALQKAKDELEVRVAERTADLKQANERLESRLAQLDFLNATSYELAQFMQIDELCPAILKAFMSRFPGGTASLCSRTKDGFRCVSAVGSLDTDAGRALSESAIDVFHRTELPRPFLLENWTRDDHYTQFAWPQEIRDFPCYLAIPLMTDNKTLSIVQVFTSSDYPELYSQEKTVLATISAHAAVCLSNAIHYQDLGEKSRLQGELDAARSIQRSFTPHYKPSIPRINLKGVYLPAFEVGGDYLDYFHTDNGNWVIVIADVCGKGIPAALLMTVLRSIFRVESRTHATAKQLLCAVNDSMKINLDEKSFITALCLVISNDGTSMTYARAGHPMLLRFGREEEPLKSLNCSGIALGLVSDPAMFSTMIEELTIPLEKGDRFLVYTDGLTEANDPEKNAYGLQRLSSVLGKYATAEPEGVIAGIMDDIKLFTRGAPYHDDLTILSMEVTD